MQQTFSKREKCNKSPLTLTRHLSVYHSVIYRTGARPIKNLPRVYVFFVRNSLCSNGFANVYHTHNSTVKHKVYLKIKSDRFFYFAILVCINRFKITISLSDRKRQITRENVTRESPVTSSADSRRVCLELSYFSNTVK